MTSDEAMELLARGGMMMAQPPGSCGHDGTEACPHTPYYSGLHDPRGTERLGVALAAMAGASSPDVVLVWEAAEDLVLAHVVARELGATVARAFSREGLLSSDGSALSGTRILLLADAFRDPGILRAIQGLAGHLGGEITGIAALVGTEALGALAGIPAFCLLSAR